MCLTACVRCLVHVLKKSNQPQTSKEPPFLQTDKEKHPENAGDTPIKINEPASPEIEKPSGFLTISGLSSFPLLAFRS